MHPCAFLSKKCFSAEQNYYVRDCEILAIKVAFEEWRPWLEEVEQPHLVGTNFKDLEHLKMAKRFNSSQVRCAFSLPVLIFLCRIAPGLRIRSMMVFLDCFHLTHDT